jgi:hypothetical protein
MHEHLTEIQLVAPYLNGSRRPRVPTYRKPRRQLPVRPRRR